MTVSVYHRTMLLRACHHLIFHSWIIWFCLSFTRRRACVRPFRLINRWCCFSGSGTGKTHTRLRSIGQMSVQQHVLINFTCLDLSACRVVFSTLSGFSSSTKETKAWVYLKSTTWVRVLAESLCCRVEDNCTCSCSNRYLFHVWAAPIPFPQSPRVKLFPLPRKLIPGAELGFQQRHSSVRVRGLSAASTLPHAPEVVVLFSEMASDGPQGNGNTEKRCGWESPLRPGRKLRHYLEKLWGTI